MSRRPVSNPLALAVLASLAERPMYPYEITTTLRERGKDDSIRLNFGSLYSVIKSLEKHGFITPSHSEREGNRPERVVYEITEAGKVEAAAWLRELLAVPSKEYPDVEAGLSLIAMLSPEEVAALLRARLASLDTEIRTRDAGLTGAAAAGLPEIFLVEADFRLAMLRAERGWIDRFAARLEAGEVGGQDGWAEMARLRAAGASPEEIEEVVRRHLPADPTP